MKECVVVVTEVRYLALYLDEPMFRGVDAELSEQGFTLHKFDFNKSIAIANSQAEKLRPRRTGDQLIDGDAVYIRDLKGIRGWTDFQVFSLAAFAGTVFGSNSLALHCLDELVRRDVVPADTPARYVPLLPEDQVRREYGP